MVAAKPTGKHRQAGNKPSPWERFSVTGLEADIAYFEARIELIGTPETINQKAQVDTFKHLEQAMGHVLNRLKRKDTDA